MVKKNITYFDGKGRDQRVIFGNKTRRAQVTVQFQESRRFLYSGKQFPVTICGNLESPAPRLTRDWILHIRAETKTGSRENAAIEAATSQWSARIDGTSSIAEHWTASGLIIPKHDGPR